jgi:hypothetical protein
MVPFLLEEVVFAATVYATDPGPFPPLPDVMVIQFVLLVADQAQPEAVDT